MRIDSPRRVMTSVELVPNLNIGFYPGRIQF